MNDSWLTVVDLSTKQNKNNTLISGEFTLQRCPSTKIHIKHIVCLNCIIHPNFSSFVPVFLLLTEHVKQSTEHRRLLVDTVIERIVYRGRIQTNNKRQELALRLNVLTNPYPLTLLFVNLTTTFQEIQYVFNTSINKVIM